MDQEESSYPNQAVAENEQRVNELASEALRLEQGNVQAAAVLWRQALDLLPPQSPKFQQIQHRLGALAAGWLPGAREIPQPQQARRTVRPPDRLPLAMAKTIGSMLVSIAVYYYVAFGNLPIAIGFVVLMLIHELGHVIATRYYGLSASPPIFIPFVGAMINLRETPPNAWVESVVGMGGPFLGTIGALASYALALSLPAHSALQVEVLYATQLGFLLNLFNLLPVPPLDGGRITAAITPWLWIPGLLGLGVLGYVEVRAAGLFGLFIPVMILLYALPRIRYTLQARGMNAPYYRVSRAKSWTMGAVYVGLGLLLFTLFKHLGGYQSLQSLMAH